MTPTPRLVPDRPTPDLLARLRCLGTLLQQLNAQTACAAVNEAIEALQDAAAPQSAAPAALAHPSRGVVDGFCPSHSWPGVDGVLMQAFVAGEQGLEFDMIRARKEIHIAQAAALPAVPDDMLRAFSDAAVDAAMTGTGIVKLTGDAGVITAMCVPPESVTLAAAPAQED